MKPLIVCTLVLLVAAAGCERGSTDPVPAQAYVGGPLGCRQLYDFLGDINKHLLTEKQTSEKTRQIRVILDAAEPPLTEAATAMVRANNAQDNDAFIDAFNALVDACVDAGLSWALGSALRMRNYRRSACGPAQSRRTWRTSPVGQERTI